LESEIIYNVSDVPISHSILSNSLANYARINDKIGYMIEKGDLTQVQRGLYVFNNVKQKNRYLNYNIANTLYGPSYVSRFSALSYYGLLSEQTVTVESMSLSRFRKYQTPMGTFTYYRSPKDTFSIGINSLVMNDYCSFLIASPEKALCDLIWTEKRIPIKNVDDMTFYLEENLRLDMGFLKNADINILQDCLMRGNKKTEIGFLLEIVKNL
jgi:hypothetical protein